MDPIVVLLWALLRLDRYSYVPLLFNLGCYAWLFDQFEYNLMYQSVKELYQIKVQGRV